MVPRLRAKWCVATFVILVLTSAALAMLVRVQPANRVETTVLDWVAGHHSSGLDAFMKPVSVLTEDVAKVPTVFFILIIIAILLVVALGPWRSFKFLVTLGAVLVLGFCVDEALGTLVGRVRPAAFSEERCFPSTQVWVYTLLLTSIGDLLRTRRAGRAQLVLYGLCSSALLAAVGFARMYESAHWPADVAGGFFLGVVLLLSLRVVGPRISGLIDKLPLVRSRGAQSGPPNLGWPALAVHPQAGPPNTASAGSHGSEVPAWVRVTP